MGVDTGESVAVCEADDTLYVAGWSTSSSMSFGPSIRLVSRGDTDGWLAKLNASTGDVLWAVNFGGAASDYANAVSIPAAPSHSVAASNMVYVTGYSYGRPLVWGTASLDSLMGMSDWFAVRVDAATGDALWIMNGGGEHDDIPGTSTAPWPPRFASL
jgi:hypothetical protein